MDGTVTRTVFGRCDHCGDYAPLYTTQLYVGGVGYVLRRYCIGQADCEARDAERIARKQAGQKATS